jgi:hypothetical protein
VQEGGGGGGGGGGMRAMRREVGRELRFDEVWEHLYAPCTLPIGCHPGFTGSSDPAAEDVGSSFHSNPNHATVGQPTCTHES